MSAKKKRRYEWLFETPPMGPIGLTGVPDSSATQVLFSIGKEERKEILRSRKPDKKTVRKSTKALSAKGKPPRIDPDKLDETVRDEPTHVFTARYIVEDDDGDSIGEAYVLNGVIEELEYESDGNSEEDSLILSRLLDQIVHDADANQANLSIELDDETGRMKTFLERYGFKGTEGDVMKRNHGGAVPFGGVDEVPGMNEVDIIESLPSDVYHITVADSLYKIFKTDEFHLAFEEVASEFAAMEDALGREERDFYSISISRSVRNNEFFDHFLTSDKTLKKIPVILVLDGNRLLGDYKAKDVEFEGFKEQESRIYSNDPVIPNAMHYIKQVHMLFAPPYNFDGAIPYVLDIVEQSRKHKGLTEEGAVIQFYFYDDAKAMGSLDLGKAISLNQAYSEVKQGESLPQRHPGDLERMQQLGEKHVSSWIELILVASEDEEFLTPDAKALLDDIRGAGIDDLMDEILHMVEEVRYFPKVMRPFTVAMTQKGLNGIGQLAEYLADKWNYV